MAFRVKKNLGKNANKGNIQVWNLNEQSIALLQDPQVVVRLFAGHENIPRLIFQGRPIQDGVKAEWQGGTDYIVKIEAQDGGRELAEANTNVTFATETRLEQVLQVCADDLGLPLGDIGELADVRLTQGVTLTGKTRDVLDRVARMNGASYTITDGALDLIATDGDSGDSAVVFSRTNGNLLRFTPKDQNKAEMKAILDGRIRPGKRFVVELAPGESGIWKARDVEFAGDTHDTEYTVSATARSAA